MFHLLLSLFAALPADELALGGLDPVALCEGAERPGDVALEERWGAYLYRFATRESLERFLADPERWCIQWDGGCARMGPLSGKGSPERYAVHEGRIYIFASDGCRAGFLAQPARFVAGPEPRAEESAESRAAGARWIEKAVAAHGGAPAIDGLSGLALSAHEESAGWQHEQVLTLARRGPHQRRSSWQPPAGDAQARGSETLWGDGEKVTCAEDGELRELTSPDALADVRRFAAREPLTHLWGRGASDFEALWRGPGELGQREVVDVLVRRRGLATTLHLDPQSGRILGLSWRGRAGEGVTRDVVETFTAWQTVAGVLLPSAREVSADGEAKPDWSFAWAEIVPAQ